MSREQSDIIHSDQDSDSEIAVAVGTGQGGEAAARSASSRRPITWADVRNVRQQSVSDPDEDEEPGVQARRGRKKSLKSKPVSELPKRTNTDAAETAKAYLCTVFLPVQILDSNWGTGHSANRPLRADHVDNIAKAFGSEYVKRFDVATRLKASVPTTVAPEVCQAVGEIISRPAHDLSSTFAIIDEANVVTLPWKGSWGRPRLEAGQHRRAALMRMYKLDPSTADGDMNEKGLYWLVDLYDQNYLDTHVGARTLLRQNMDTLYRPSSDGDNLNLVFNTFENLSEDRKWAYTRSNAVFTEFVTSIVGVKAGAQRYLPIISHRELFNVVKDFVQRTWGRQTITISATYTIISCMLDAILIAEWDDLISEVDHRLPFGASRIARLEDLKVLQKLSVPRREPALRALFYPTEKLFKGVGKKSPPTYVTHALFDHECNSESVAAFPISTVTPDAAAPDENEVVRRRPRFLSDLSDTAYQQLFNHMVSDNEACLQFPSWDDFVYDIRTVAADASTILHHVVLWFNPTFEKPSTSSGDRKDFQWLKALHSMVTAKRSSNRPQPLHTYQWRSEEKDAYRLLRRLWNHIRQNIRLFNNASVKAWMTIPENKTNQGGSEYAGRFSNPLWNRVLEIVWKFTGGTFPQSSLVYDFRCLEVIENARRPWTVWGVNIQQTQFSSNPELTTHPILKTKENRTLLQEEAELFGARMGYIMTKRALLKHNRYAEVAATSEASPTHVMDEPQRLAVLSRCKEYAFYLNDTLINKGFSVDAENDADDTASILPSSGFNRDAAAGSGAVQRTNESDEDDMSDSRHEVQHTRRMSASGQLPPGTPGSVSKRRKIHSIGVTPPAPPQFRPDANQ